MVQAVLRRRLSGLGRSAVQAFEHRSVRLPDDVPADLQGRRHLVVVDARTAPAPPRSGALARPPTALPLTASIALASAACRIGIARPARAASPALPAALRPLRSHSRVRDEQRHEVRALVAVDHRLGDLRPLGQQALDPRRRDVVAAGVDDDVLLAIGDAQVAVGIDLADVAGVQPAVADASRASPSSLRQ